MFRPEIQTYQTIAESPFSESQETELAAEVLAAGSERALNRFLLELLHRATSAGRSLHPSVVQGLGGLLKGAILKVFPKKGQAFAGPFLGELADGVERMSGSRWKGSAPRTRNSSLPINYSGSAVRQQYSQPPIRTRTTALSQPDKRWPKRHGSTPLAL